MLLKPFEVVELNNKWREEQAQGSGWTLDDDEVPVPRFPSGGPAHLYRRARSRVGLSPWRRTWRRR